MKASTVLRLSTSPGTIRTVFGDLDAATLTWDYHEHLFQTSPLLPGEEIDDPDRSRDEAVLLTAAGITAMVEATPIGLGRRPHAVAAISAATGLTVVRVTGAHRAEHYSGDHPLLGEDEAAGEVPTDRRHHAPVHGTLPVPPLRAGRRRQLDGGAPAAARRSVG